MTDYPERFIRAQDVPASGMVAIIESVLAYPGSYSSHTQIEVEISLRGLGQKRLTKIDLRNLNMSLGTSDTSAFVGRRIRIRCETGHFDGHPKNYVRILPDPVSGAPAEEGAQA